MKKKKNWRSWRSLQILEEILEEEEHDEDGEEEEIDEEEEQEILAEDADEEEEIQKEEECDAAFAKLPEREQTMFGDLHLAVLKEVSSNNIKPLSSILHQLRLMRPPEIQFCLESYDKACAARNSEADAGGSRVSGDGVPSLPVGADAGESRLSELHMCNLSDTTANTETAGGQTTAHHRIEADAGGSTHNPGGSTHNHATLDEWHCREFDAAAWADYDDAAAVADAAWTDYDYWSWHAAQWPSWGLHYLGPQQLLNHLNYHFGQLLKLAPDTRIGRESMSTKLWELHRGATPPSMENPVFFNICTFVLEEAESLAMDEKDIVMPSDGGVVVQKILVLSAAEEKTRIIERLLTSADQMIYHPSGCFVASQIMEEANREADRPGDDRSVIEAAHNFMMRAHKAPADGEQQYLDKLRKSMMHMHANHSFRLWVLGLKKAAALPHETRELDAMLAVVRIQARDMVMNSVACRIVNELLRKAALYRLQPIWEALVQDPDDTPEDRVESLIDHPFANHTIQVFIEAPQSEKLAHHIICRVVQNNFAKYVVHPHANYVVQKCLLVAGRYWLLQYAQAYIEHSDAIHSLDPDYVEKTVDPLNSWIRLSDKVKGLKNEKVANWVGDLEPGDEATTKKVAECLDNCRPPWFPHGRWVLAAPNLPKPMPKRRPRAWPRAR